MKKVKSIGVVIVINVSTTIRDKVMKVAIVR